MADELSVCYRQSLATDVLALVEPCLSALEEARFGDVLSDSLVKSLVGRDESSTAADSQSNLGEEWLRRLQRKLDELLSQDGGTDRPGPECRDILLLAALAALQAFQQSNVTGPPLSFDTAGLVLPPAASTSRRALQDVRRSLINSLGVDGIGAYKLTPNVELLCLANAILERREIYEYTWTARWARMRKDFLRQRILSEESSTLQTAIYQSLDQVAEKLKDNVDGLLSFLQEQAAIHIHHGHDKKAREALDKATKLNKFEFALTGLLGKRTKFQLKDLSQLVVLAKSQHAVSSDESIEPTNGEDTATRPENLDLNDDTLLESISFSKKSEYSLQSTTDIKTAESLPQSLLELDPGSQPLLQPTDSITLLLYASSITNTSPSDGLTREETLPYALRVLDGGSSNWQIYTQALLVRSRIEGFKSRTIERGLLQLQALVDQVIAETTSAPESKRADGTASDETPSGANSEAASTFLPRPTASESAPPAQRLRYIYPLCSPTRWEIEAELASRWVSLGGLRSALEIYERLEMWAEAALCWAATEREDRARAVVRQQLFHCTTGKDKDADAAGDEAELWQGEERDPPPADAPRLYCILGDLDSDKNMYEEAWRVSTGRYSRAQRSLGRLAFAAKDFAGAVSAYKLAVSQNQLHGPSWFALGCAQLELSDFAGAANAFTRTVQLDDSDAEAWSNLASALLRLDPDEASVAPIQDASASHAHAVLDDDDFTPEEAASSAQLDPQRFKRDALKALNKAAAMKYESFRIWDNLLTVAASMRPPAYNDVVVAMRRIIEMRGPTDGEACVDATILEYLVRHVITQSEDPETGRAEYVAGKPGLQRMVVDMVDKQVVPLITASARLWGSVARLALWRQRPGSALEAHEKAWRAVTSQPGWENSSEARWEEAVEATVELVDAYASLGPMERTEGLATGSGELVAKDWKFKARSAVKSVLGKGREMWQDGGGWERLQASLEELKS